MAEAIDLERELDRLYSAPLGEFVALRDALAARLKGAGDREGAAAVKARKKPSAAAWAVNQLPFSAPEVWAAVVEAGDRLRSVAADEVRDALQERREAIAAARRKAETLLEEAGHAAATQTMLKIAATLEALGTYGSAPGHPVAGRLTEELEPPSFEEIAALALPKVPVPKPEAPAPRRPEPPPVPERPEPPPKAEEKRPPREPERRVDEVALARARKAAALAREKVEVAARTREGAGERLRAAEQKAKESRAAREELERRLAEAEREERKDEADLEKVREALEAAEAAVASAREALAAAEARIVEVESGRPG